MVANRQRNSRRRRRSVSNVLANRPSATAARGTAWQSPGSRRHGFHSGGDGLTRTNSVGLGPYTNTKRGIFMSTSAAQQPSPQLFFQTINAHQRTEALKAGIELEVFTAIGEGNSTAADIAKRCQASEKGIRVLCDYLTIMEMLTKKDGQYGLTLDSSVVLDKRSPAYIGGATEFLCSPMLTEGSKHMTEAVRKGGTAMEGDGTLGPDHPIWVKFARGMAPMMAMPAQLMAPLVDPNADQKLKILDIAAGHGLYGINFATRNKQAEVTAVDWKAVLEVAKENAQKMGVADRS